MSRRREDLTGQTFGHLLVTEDIQERVRGNAVLKCTCTACETSNVIRYKGLVKSGKSTHCGCLRGKHISEACQDHGLSGTPLYNSWHRLRAKGLIENVWLDFQTVVNAVIYTSHTIGPRNPGKLGPANYELYPRSRSSKSRLISCCYLTKSASEWAEFLGVSRQRVHQLIEQDKLESRIQRHFQESGSL